MIGNKFSANLLEIVMTVKKLQIALSNPQKKLERDISGSLKKSKIPSHCRFPLANLHSGESVDYVPYENIAQDLKELCIKRGNLKYLEGKIVDAKLKKIGHPIFFCRTNNIFHVHCEKSQHRYSTAHFNVNFFCKSHNNLESPI